MPRDLAQGRSGDDVRNLQTLLNYHVSTPNVPLDTDGQFGPLTNVRVRQFQSLNHLDVDGIVGPLTRAVLLDTRLIKFSAELTPSGAMGPVVAFSTARKITSSFARPAFPVSNFGASSAANATVSGPPLHRQFQLFAGQQININPWFVQPMVITGQFNWLAKNDGKPDFVLTLGGQVSLNQVTGPSGTWSGQGFAQMGLSGLFKPGSFDLLNPFVVAMLQKNQGQPFGFGAGLGNQMNYNLTPDGFLSLFINTQAVINTDLKTGQTSAPGLQILGGVGFTFDSK